MNEHHDVTNSTGRGHREWSVDAPQLLTGHVTPKVVVVKVGKLEIEAGTDAFAGSRVLIDGKSWPVRSIVLRGSVDQAWTAEIEFFPTLFKDQ